MYKIHNNSKNIYTFFIALLPLFSVYASGIPGFTLGDIVLLCFFIHSIVISLKTNSIEINKNAFSLVALIVVIIFLSMVSILFQNTLDIYDIFIRVTRRTFYYLSVIIISSRFFNIRIGENIIINVGKIGAIFLALQYLSFYAGHFVLHGYLTALPLYHENYSLIDYESLYQNMFRPTSFLLEPAHISRYLCIPLVFLIFNENMKSSFVWGVIITIAIVASTSGTGLICAGAIWICFFAYRFKQYLMSRRIKLNYIFTLVSLVIITIILLNTSVVQGAIGRIFSSNLTDVNTAAGARFRGYIQYFQLPLFYQIIGKGYGSTPDTSLVTWFSGASYILYGCGIIGFITCLYLFFDILFKSKLVEQKILGLVFLLLFFMDDCFMSHVSVVYLSFIYAFSITSRELNIKTN